VLVICRNCSFVGSISSTNKSQSESIAETMVKGYIIPSRQMFISPGKTSLLFILVLLVANFLDGGAGATEVNTSLMLRQVHIITRHGSLEENGDRSLLTPMGQRQMYDLGSWLRRKYKDALPDIVGDDVPFNPSKVRIESSEFDLTIVSAQSLAMGLFPQSTRESNGLSLLPYIPPIVPVYTIKAINDITMRAYDKCDTLQNKLRSLYESRDWKNYEREHKELLEYLANIPAFAKYKRGKSIPLEDVWNVYDTINVAKIECNHKLPADLSMGVFSESSSSCSTPEGTSLKDILVESKWEELQQIVHYSELAKYGSNHTTGVFIGSNLLNQILYRMNKDPNISLRSDGQSDALGYDKTRLNVYSGHYPTILGIFAALDIPFFPKDYSNWDHTTSQVIPEYGSALIFELYQDFATNSKVIKIYYKPGNIYTDVDLLDVRVNTYGEDPVCEKSSTCPLTNFEQILQRKTFGYVAKWCNKCNNNSADVCLAAQASGNFNILDQYGQFTVNLGTCSSREYVIISLLAAIGGATISIAFVTVFSGLCIKKNTNTRNNDAATLNNNDRVITLIANDSNNNATRASISGGNIRRVQNLRTSTSNNNRNLASDNSNIVERLPHYQHISPERSSHETSSLQPEDATNNESSSSNMIIPEVL